MACAQGVTRIPCYQIHLTLHSIPCENSTRGPKGEINLRNFEHMDWETNVPRISTGDWECNYLQISECTGKAAISQMLLLEKGDVIRVW